MIGLVGAMVSFEEGAELLGELAGIGVNAKQIERTAEALGAAIADDERQRVAPSPPQLAPTLYLGMDGTGIPMRATELAGRQGKQHDGSAKTREVKLCTLWRAEGRDAEGTPVRDEGSITYSPALESAASRDTDTAPSQFAQRVQRKARRRGFELANRQVVLGDGAPWIWNLADEYFPRAIQIVDRFHVKQHLSDVAKAIYGTGVVEAGGKVAIGTRLKRAGMHWTLAGANAIIALRCCKLSRRFADFWEVRAQRRVSAQYQNRVVRPRAAVDLTPLARYVGEFAAEATTAPAFDVIELRDAAQPEFAAAIDVCRRAFDSPSTAVEPASFVRVLKRYSEPGYRYHLWAVRGRADGKVAGMASFFGFAGMGFGGYVVLEGALRGAVGPINFRKYFTVTSLLYQCSDSMCLCRLTN